MQIASYRPMGRAIALGAALVTAASIGAAASAGTGAGAEQPLLREIAHSPDPR